MTADTTRSETADAMPGPRPWRRWLMVLFWLAYLLWTSLVLIYGEGRERVQALPVPIQIIISPLMIPLLWYVLHRFQPQLTNLLRRIKLPVVVKFLIGGLLIGVVLGVNFTISFGLSGTDHYRTGVAGADLHPNPLINTLLYFGPYGGTMLAWYLMRYIFKFDWRHVFWLAGLVGGLTEPSKLATQDFVVLQMFVGGEPLDALLTLITLIAAYGVPIAGIWVIMPPEELPQGQRRVGCLGAGALWFVGLVASFVAPIISFALIDLMLGTNFLD